jgi:hypothetical protein
MMKKNNRKEKKLPGYPHYPQEEDIMNQEERIEVNPEEVPDNLSRAEVFRQNTGLAKGTKGEKPGKRKIRSKKIQKEVNPGLQSDSDVSGDEAELLANEGWDVDPMFLPDDLDVPGSELDDESEMIGSEDEENNYYSLGGADKENLEENPL